ncbi:toll/interleukin-1 receptor domain-containing protein [Pseudofrankia sp. BMG5.36]|uniref:toll/interleukin-1 receptor domain-containing protein n=1 Tax=Pseudofrankia sp. BMG5.36 TaxID=1834512 RepID=UPI0008D9D095|nr:toll/interleukin-1 receptor domain-containing protein [Pseudofrankia sp. BMG5.36]OHV43435.1 hypothetical protein BCD48_28065 [Pseudofrankia sp. BMG5.36]
MDYFISYTGADLAWAEWIAWQLEATGHTTLIQAWDFGPGAHFVTEMHRASQAAERTIAVLSTAYQRSDHAEAEWQAAWGANPSGEMRRLLVFRVEDCDRPRLLRQLVTVDLFGLDHDAARDQLLAATANQRRKPAKSPAFPAISTEPGGSVAPPRFPSSRPPGAVRVGDADPRRLGVHPAISVAGVPDDAPPEYVLRDVDTAEFGVRARLRAAAGRGGFVLLVGGSSVGKTRCAYEALGALPADWWLVHPAGPREVAALVGRVPGRTVVWLDEIQRHLDGENGLTGGTVRALLAAPGPVVIVGTLWPGRYATYTALPSGGADPRAREREVLDLADVVRVAPDFSAAEQTRAEKAAAGDRRLRVALDSRGYGLTQTLAAAPHLVARWDDAKTAHPYAWAVLTAALDAARLGALRAPLPADLLRRAAVDYCTPRQQAEAPAGWFEQALDYATRTLHGATAALTPVASGSMGQVAGYTVADYLFQHVTAVRRFDRVPASTWSALVEHVNDAADCTRLADSALARLLYGIAIPLYRTAADAGDIHASARLADVLAERRDLDGLRRRADTGDSFAAHTLDRLFVDDLVERGDLDELRRRPHLDLGYAMRRLADVLAERGDLDELRRRADTGDPFAAQQLTDVLAEEDFDELCRQARSGNNPYAAMSLAKINIDHYDRYDDDTLRAFIEGMGDGHALLLLRRRTINRIDDLDELRRWTDDGNTYAAQRLADVLAERGDLDELRRWVDAGYLYVGERLASLLAKRGGSVEADRLRRFGFNPDGSIASGSQ